MGTDRFKAYPFTSTLDRITTFHDMCAKKLNLYPKQKRKWQLEILGVDI